MKLLLRDTNGVDNLALELDLGGGDEGMDLHGCSLLRVG
jgi:hypothetical protein